MALKWTFKIRYSSQLLKKNKSWTDGYMYYIVGLKKAVLLDESGKTLDVLQPVNAGDLQVGGELLMERYVVTVDEGPFEAPLEKLFKKAVDVMAPADDAFEPECDLHVSGSSSTTDSMFAILYSKDKTKKTKKWLDGYVAVGSATNIIVSLDSLSFL